MAGSLQGKRVAILATTASSRWNCSSHATRSTMQVQRHSSFLRGRGRSRGGSTIIGERRSPWMRRSLESALGISMRC